jgi:hypothetical protein
VSVFVRSAEFRRIVREIELSPILKVRSQVSKRVRAERTSASSRDKFSTLIDPFNERLPRMKTLMIEVKNLLAKVKILKRSGAAVADSKRVLVIGYGNTLLRGQDRPVTVGRLVGFSSCTGCTGRYILVGIPCSFTIVGVELRLVTASAFLCHFYFLLKQSLTERRSPNHA